MGNAGRASVLVAGRHRPVLRHDRGVGVIAEPGSCVNVMAGDAVSGQASEQMSSRSSEQQIAEGSYRSGRWIRSRRRLVDDWAGTVSAGTPVARAERRGSVGS